MNKQTSIPGMEEHNLEEQALAQLKATHYKEAISLFKKLLQTSENAVWQQKLAYCYVQRAVQFAAKGMYKEAVVLWENHIPYAQAPYNGHEQYIFWLIQTNKQVNIQASLNALSVQQLDKNFPALAAILGALMLTEHPEFEQYLPQDSALITHFNIIKKALQAYQGVDNEVLAEALKLLPYRSAFRDLRTLLNATLLMPSSVQKARELLNKIPQKSVYFHSAKTLLASTKEGTELADELIHLSHQQCAVIGAIKGLNKKQLDFIQHYSNHHDELTDKVKFKMAIQFQSIIGSELTQQFCQNILMSYPAGKKEFNKHFKRVSKFEENRIKALNCEQDNNPYDAEQYWRRCIGILKEEGTDNSFKIALILRRLAAREADDEDRADSLIDSLEYDPSDRNSYLKILQCYSHDRENHQEYKLWLTKTLEQFPQDVEVLTQAVKAAMRNKTYKKASQYANKILKIDPLNSYAKQTLFSSYLAHARSLMREKTYRLVEKEIIQAEQLNIGRAYQNQAQLMRALLSFVNEDKQQGLQRIVEALAVLYTDPVNRHLLATMEALLNNLPVATILRELPSAKEHLLSVQELTELLKQLEKFSTDNDNLAFLLKAVEKIKAPLKNSLSEQKYPEELLLKFCKIMDSIDNFELLRHCVKATPEKWNKPTWKYYRVYANTNGDAASCSNFQVQQLQIFHEEAGREKEYQAEILIEKYLGRYYDAHPQQGNGYLDEFFSDFLGDDEDDLDDSMEILFGHLDEELLVKLNNKAELIMKKQTPEKLIQGFLRQVGNREAILVAVMQNPDILSALMLVKAANELKIDIEVDIDDVINIFDIDDDKSSFPFPF